MVGVLEGKSGRVAMFLLLHARRLVSQKQVVEETGLSKGLVSRVMRVLVDKGVVKRPYRTRFSLEYPEQLLLDWAGHRDIALRRAFFARDASVLDEVKHAHTLFSGAWLDTGFLRSDVVTVYVEPGFKPVDSMAEGRVGELKTKTALIEADDEFVFYGKRVIQGKHVVNPFLLYADLASLGGMASSALEAVAEKHGFPRLT